MADTTKKTKTTTKARKPAAKKEKTAQALRPAMPSRYAEQDWLRAEQELLKMAS
jgi:hypothetical protein